MHFRPRPRPSGVLDDQPLAASTGGTFSASSEVSAATVPAMPLGYFDDESHRLLESFEAQVLARPNDPIS